MPHLTRDQPRVLVVHYLLVTHAPDLRPAGRAGKRKSKAVWTQDLMGKLQALARVRCHASMHFPTELSFLRDPGGFLKVQKGERQFSFSGDTSNWTGMYETRSM